MSAHADLVDEDVALLSSPLPVPSQSSKSVASPSLQATSMTPPPSAHLRHTRSPGMNETTQPSSIDCPSTPVARFNTSSSLPTPEKVATANIDELRVMVQDLVGALTDARMSAAHFKLQHTLLVMETNEAAQRAEVEHYMARREVEVLQAAEHRHRTAAAATPKPVVSSPQPQVMALTRTCKDLEDERDDVEEQLKETKRFLEFEKDRAELLIEENGLLKKRIRENREHFTKLKDQSPMYATPRQAPFTTPRRKSYLQFPDDKPAHDNFAALLYADQMLSQETVSVPSTPTRSHATKTKRGHTRGAHSLSSLQITPVQKVLASGQYTGPQTVPSLPGSQLINELSGSDRHDRDSTISISEAEDESGGEDVGQSQASSLAADLLRRHPTSQETMRQSQDAERSSSLLQTKIFGNVKKASSNKAGGKRGREVSSSHAKGKRSRLDESVGLGVRMNNWSRVPS